MAVAHHLRAEEDPSYRERNVIAVIGDGSISAGMAYEAMNNAAVAGPGAERLIVILNDNEMSIAPPVGAMSNYLSRLMSSRKFMGLRELAGKFVKKLPAPVERTARKADEYARGMIDLSESHLKVLHWHYKAAARFRRAAPNLGQQSFL